ncbi:Planctomycete cytochrome C [Rubripirellula lacrimiformis]|uniref:Planctomycete cytochrome C n=1 Tax=Rubripirellula lacrimiformis TaxID=1930273 RepID=A0A517NED4_9BACT|nr:DUF1553 domain-containing protein [Rubripirellula lacrimiformis]QDT05499.1 Planctomycete cytochrome C [Rubripirellula lacrimiformis]
MVSSSLVKRWRWLPGAWLICWFGLGIDGVAAELDNEIRFDRDVLPILSDTCFPCHGPDPQARQADLRFDLESAAKGDPDGSPVIVPFQPQDSEFVRRLLTDDAGEVMPPPDARRLLTDAEKQTLVRWVRQGAVWGQHWAFVQPERPPLPAVADTTWVRNGIDRFVLARLESEGLHPAEPASKAKLIRRVTLDLTGLPPTPQEVADFLDDQRPDAYERVVDRLLKSPRYGEQMAMPWLDAARFADTDGYQFDGPRVMWRWRDWVIDAYNRNMPFDQFTIQQLAGDLLPNPSIDQLIATGFNRNHRYNSEAGIVVDEFLLENAVDRVDTTSTVWLGLTMGCARCHDHKYDPVSQKDYYQLIAYFNNVPEAGRAIKAGNSEPYILAPTAAQQQRLDGLDRRVEDAEAALKSATMVASQHKWEALIADGNDTTNLSAGHQRSGKQAPTNQTLVRRGLRQHYAFSGTLPADSKVQSGTERYEPGPVGDALKCDGDTVIAVANRSTGKVKKAKSRFTDFSCAEPYSLSFWIRPTAVKHGVVLSRQETGMGRKGVSVELRDGHLVFSVISRWVAGAGVVVTQSKLAPGEWVHVSVSNDGSQRATAQKIYLDGVAVPVTVELNTNSNTGGAGKSDPLRIGGGPHGPNFTGSIDEVRYDSHELTPDEALVIAEPATVREIANIDPPKRTDRQTAKLRAAFYENGPGRDVYQTYLDAIANRQQYAATLPTCMVMAEDPNPKPTFVRVRGVYHDLGDQVERDVPAVLPPMSADLPRNRLGLAKWIVSDQNPLTARVTVNRYWQKYFGTGIVQTTEDFGIQGDMPSHRGLLDWLATEFLRTQWDVAGMQRLIVTSATYRQSSNMTPEHLQRDPANRLLARGPRTRLPGPVLRDQALFVSGLLVETVGGPSVSPYQPDDLWIEMSMGQRYRQSKGADLFRRSLYTTWKRTVNPPSMAILDAADRESCWVGIKRTNTPLQALTLLNETAFVEAARHLASRMIREGEGDPIGFGFRCVTACDPSDHERAILEDAAAEYWSIYRADPEAAGKLIATGSTAVNADLNPARLAAYTAIANVLLNLDQVISNE